MKPSWQSTLFRVAIYVAFFASGAACLVSEVTWNRMLTVVAGNSLSAAATILAVFMGGLGLGSYAGGRFFARRAPSLLPYLLLQAAIGVYVLFSPALFGLFADLFTTLAGMVASRGLLTGVRLFVTTAALLLPAFLMGATFPAMIAGAARARSSKTTARTGYLYSVNTLGAAVGCFAAGYHLLLEFGVQTTLAVAMGLYTLAALCALTAHVCSGRAPQPATAPEAPFEAVAAPPSPSLRRYLVAASFAVGFVALAYEVLLTRLGILYLGNTVSVFPLVLTSFLLGTGISAVAGTWVYGALVRRLPAAGNKLFGIFALAAGAVILLPPYVLLSDRFIGTEHLASVANAGFRNPWPILMIMLAPTLLIGALLPVAIRMLQPDSRGEATHGAATLYAYNTAGGLVGAAVANHYLVPLIGAQTTLVLLSMLLVGVGLFNLTSPGRNALRWAAATATAILTIALLTGLPDLLSLYAGKVARSTQARSTKVQLVREGRAATVTVIDQADPRLGTYRDMYLNGVEEASTRFWHTQLFKLLGILPPLVHASDAPKDALVVAFGAGITAGSVLASDQVASLDVVDLNPDIKGINDLFTDVNGDVFHQPRFTFHNDDGRNFLVTSNKTYDLIISDSTHPRAYDSWIFYTREFYRAVKKHLRPGGIFAQWVPVLGSMQGDLFKIHLRTFRETFPYTTFWYIYGSDQAFLLATPEPLAIDAVKLQARLDRLPAWFKAREYQIDTVSRIAGFFWLDQGAMARMIGSETRVNTDDRHYFDKQSAVWPAPPEFRLPRFQASVLSYFENADDALFAAAREEQQVAQLVARYGFFQARQDLFRAYCLDPENGNVRYWMARALGREELPPPGSFCESDAVRGLRAMLQRVPNHVTALNTLAGLLADEGRLDEALPLAQKAAGIAPRNGMVLDTLGWILVKQQKIDEGLGVLVKADASLPDHPIVLYHLGAAYAAAGQNDQARRHLEKALSISNNFQEAEHARRLLARDA